jgi:hypothetical protein
VFLTIFVCESRDDDDERRRRRQWQQQVETHTFVHEWEARERERELFPHPISQHTHDLLMDIGLLKFYQEGTSLRGNSLLLQQLIHHWDHGRQGFRVGPICGIIPWRRMSISSLGCLGGGSIFPISLCYYHGVAGETQLAYVQRYVSLIFIPLQSSRFMVVSCG